VQQKGICMANHICPWWIGYLLLSPLRRWGQNPKKILAPYIMSGMTVLDLGCAMGYFSLDMAELVGINGKVICVDVQQKMLDALMKRASRTGFHENIESRLCKADNLYLEDMKNKIDFALAFAVIHEVDGPEMVFKQIFTSLKPGAWLLFSEPSGHVSAKKFQKSIGIAEKFGFKPAAGPRILRSRSVLLEK